MAQVKIVLNRGYIMLSKNLMKILILMCIFTSSIHLTAMFRHIKQTTPHFSTPISATTKQKIKEIEVQRAQEDAEIQRLEKQTEEEIATLQIKAQRLKQCYDLMILIDDTEKV